MKIKRITEKELVELKESKNINKDFFVFSLKNYKNSREEDLRYLNFKLNSLLIESKREFISFELYFYFLKNIDTSTSNTIDQINNINISKNCQNLNLKVFKKIEKILKLIRVVKTDLKKLKKIEKKG